MLARRRALANPEEAPFSLGSDRPPQAPVPDLRGAAVARTGSGAYQGREHRERAGGSMRKATRVAIFLAAALPALALGSTGRAEGIREEALTIPAVLSGGGASRTIELEALVLRPDDSKPHPLAVINHGSPREADDRSAMSHYAMWPQARAFARRAGLAGASDIAAVARFMAAQPYVGKGG
jgi:hypothetical protein